MAFSGEQLGDPAPIGLLAFAFTTSFLMYIDMGWVEKEFKEMVWGYATWYGGVAQLLVGFFELVKGNTFGATAFASYGAFWLGWAEMYGAHREGFLGGPETWETGEGFWLLTFGVLTTCFWVITLKKNLCLVTVFGLLSITFYILTIAVWTGETAVTRVGGYFGFATAISTFYTAFAELFAHEWGYHVLPGLAPLRRPSKAITEESLAKRVSYESRSNTLLIDLHDLEVTSADDIEALKEAITSKIKSAGRKVDAIVNYHGFNVSPALAERYQGMVLELQSEYYQSVHRYHTDLFQNSAVPFSSAAPLRAAELEGLVQQLQRENAHLRGTAAGRASGGNEGQGSQ